VKSLIHRKYYLLIGLLAELLILLVAYWQTNDTGGLFQLVARYSGRLSLVYFLLPWWAYLQSDRHDSTELLLAPLRTFAILHVIHFIFLILNVYLNAIALIPVKLIGGSLGYLMIVLWPFMGSWLAHRNWAFNLYFLYVGIVMMVTYVSRIKGDFEGSAPSPIHYFAFGILAISMLFFIRVLGKQWSPKKPQEGA
jgi:hypothetical protein